MTCWDFLQDGNETDIDCGGDCWERCRVGEGCSVNADCMTSKCVNNFCAPIPPTGKYATGSGAANLPSSYDVEPSSMTGALVFFIVLLLIIPVSIRYIEIQCRHASHRRELLSSLQPLIEMRRSNNA